MMKLKDMEKNEMGVVVVELGGGIDGCGGGI